MYSTENYTDKERETLCKGCEASCKYNPTTWSEEDERLCSCLIEEQEESLDKVKNDKYGHSEIISDLKEMYRERIAWLEALKGRVNPQPKQEWKPNEEQMEAFDLVLTNEAMDDNIKHILCGLKEQLKKL